MAIQLVQGDFVCWNVLLCFCSAAGAYAALELAWRGTTHWTMFLTGKGSASAFCRRWRIVRCRWAGGAPAAAVGAAGVSAGAGVGLAVGAAYWLPGGHTAVTNY